MIEYKIIGTLHIMQVLFIVVYPFIIKKICYSIVFIYLFCHL